MLIQAGPLHPGEEAEQGREVARGWQEGEDVEQRVGRWLGGDGLGEIALEADRVAAARDS